MLIIYVIELTLFETLQKIQPDYIFLKDILYPFFDKLPFLLVKLLFVFARFKINNDKQ